MNLNTYIIRVLLAVCILITSCDLVEVSKIEPVNQLGEDQAITTVNQAQSVLYGTYGQLKTFALHTTSPGLYALLGGTMVPGASGGTSEASFRDNNVDPQNGTLAGIYSQWYKVLNNANHIIEKTAKIATTEPRKESLIGEAKFIRALSHFYLLRAFGQFYDMNSTYGIVLKDKPIQSADPQARATVKECYDLIIADLDYAIAKAPSFKSTFYASKQASMALKAKVLLYMKKYSDAATLSAQVIAGGPFQLETTFGDVFTKKIVNTKEVLFQIPYDDKNDRNNKAFVFRSSYLPSPSYIARMNGDKRAAAALITVGTTMRNNKYNGTTFNSQVLTADTEYFLRLDEMYLIQAEAIVRSNGNFDDALKAINTIRTRAGMPVLTSNIKAELLELIRIEKILELGAESGEEWFDMVRYAIEDNFDIKSVKPGVTSKDKYILPIPFNSVDLSNKVVIQNPNY